LRYFCSPQHTDSAFYPIIGQMERAAGRAHDYSAQAKLDKLDALLAQTSTTTAGGDSTPSRIACSPATIVQTKRRPGGWGTPNLGPH